MWAVPFDPSRPRPDFPHPPQLVLVFGATAALEEGTETVEQLEILHRKNIDSVQGYLIGVPMRSAQLGALIAGADGSDPGTKKPAFPVTGIHAG